MHFYELKKKRKKLKESMDNLNTSGMLLSWAFSWFFPLPVTLSPEYPHSLRQAFAPLLPVREASPRHTI